MGNHMCQINGAGRVKCWGYNSNGQLGIGSTFDVGNGIYQMGSNLTFVNVGNKVFAKEICTGLSGFTCILTTTDGVKCWGNNGDGQLGQGDTNQRGDFQSNIGDNLPFIQLGSVSKPTKVFCGNKHACALFANKKVKCWGSNSVGSLGYEGFSNKGKLSSDMGDNLGFVNLGSNLLVDFLVSQTSSDHNCVIISNSQLMKCWGSNSNGELGTGKQGHVGYNPDTMGENLLTADLGTESRVKGIGLGEGSTCAVRIDDVLLCFGQNFFGQFGIGTKSQVTAMGSSLIATEYDAFKKIKLVIGSSKHMCFLYDDNITIKCLGSNSYGELGQGDKTNRGDSPTSLLTSTVAINLGTNDLPIDTVRVAGDTTCIFFQDHRVKCFGDGAYGELGSGSPSPIGISAEQMGSGLPFVDVFQQTNAPTQSPFQICQSTKKNLCLKDIHCIWKKNLCSISACSGYSLKPDCKADKSCQWKKNTCRPK